MLNLFTKKKICNYTGWFREWKHYVTWNINTFVLHDFMIILIYRGNKIGLYSIKSIVTSLFIKQANLVLKLTVDILVCIGPIYSSIKGANQTYLNSMFCIKTPQSNSALTVAARSGRTIEAEMIKKFFWLLNRNYANQTGLINMAGPAENGL